MLLRLPLVALGLLAALVIIPAQAPAEDARELAVIAAAQDSPTAGAIGPVRLDRYGGVVIRSPEELVAHSDKPDAAKDSTVQNEKAAELAKILQVEAIDWKTQMVVAVRGEPGTRADRVQFEPLRVEGTVLTVAWKVKQRPPHAGPGTPIAVVLVDRFEGEVKFIP
jgi:hypothetical protein